MSDDKIEEIRAQHKASDNNFIEYESTWDIHAHRAFLLTEVDRQRAEIERLRKALQESACACSSIRECASTWARQDECAHLTARNALEGKP